MPNKNEQMIYDGQNRCRRCDRPLSDPNALYGWRCAQILGYDNYKRTVSLLDETALNGYNRYVAKYMSKEKSDNNESFTVKGKGYTNTFVREKNDDPDTDIVKYKIVSDITVWGKDYQVKYTITDGGVSFKFEDNDDYWSILCNGGARKVAKAIYDAGKKLSPENLSGRTVDGINKELQLHFAAYTLGIKKGNASPADIGGIKAPGKDANAWFFEAIEMGSDIIEPKAVKTLNYVMEIWEKSLQ